MFKGKLIVFAAMMMLLAGLVVAQSWSYTVTLEPAVGASHDLAFGVSTGGTDGYDAYLDVPYFTPPDGKGAFFPLDDPSYPKLSTDIRGRDVPLAYKYWVMRPEGYYGLDDRYARWDTTDIPDDGFFVVASKSIIEDITDIDPADWVDMSAVEEFVFGPIEDVVVRYMPVEMFDLEPPYVTGFDPLPGEGGVDLAENIQFDIKDDIAGVDETSIVVMLWIGGDILTAVDVTDLVVWTPLVGGFRATLGPVDLTGLWPELDSIYYSVTACDLSDSVNCMAEPVVVSFTTTELIEDTDPPEFYNMAPLDGDTLVDIYECISVSIRDNERGVDSSTIVLTVNTVVIPRADYTITELGTGINRYSVEYCPPGVMPYATWFTVKISAADFADVPNESDTTWMFRVKDPGDVAEFTYPLKLHSIDGVDTATTNLTIGLDTDGSDDYDSGLDVPQFLIPGRARGYFPLFDPTHPEVPTLSTDIKSTDYGIKQWIIDVFEPDAELVLAWDNSALPVPSKFEFAVIDRGAIPVGGDYVLMDLYETASFDAGQQVFIRMLPGDSVDTTPPVILSISHEDSGTSVINPLTFDVVDYQSGVDIESFTMSINGSAVTTYTATYISGGSHITYMPGIGTWNNLTTYTVDIHVDDNAPVPNHRHKIWTFTTGSIACGPEFDLGLQFDYGDIEEITFGMDTEASDGFDATLEEILPPPSPSASGYHFVSSDPVPYNRLVTDYRNNCSLGSIWEVGVVSSDHPSVEVTWNSSAPIFSASGEVIVYFKIQSVLDPMPARPYEDATWSVLSDETSVTYVSNTQSLFISVDYPDSVMHEYYNISGTVNVFGDDNNSGVRVQVTGGSWVETDSIGSYLFTSLPLGCHELTYTYGSWTPVIDTVCCSVTDSTVINDVTVYPACQPVFGVISVDGTPMMGVNVMVVSAAGTDTFQMNTLSGGSYEFPCVPSGETYTLIVSYPAYPLWDTTFTVAAVDIEIDHNLIQVPVEISGTATIEGLAMPGIAISVDGAPTGVVTDTTGAFLDSVLIGLHTICASYPGYFDACTLLNIPREGYSGIVFRLEPAPVNLRVEVDLGSGTDESGASVTLVGIGTETTPSTGVVNFADIVVHGYYNLTVTAPFHKSVSIDSILLIADDTLDVALCYLAPITAFTVAGETMMRPTTAALSIDLSWTEPGTLCAMPDTYYVCRSQLPFTDATLPTVSLIAKVPAPAAAYSDTLVADGTHYYYDVEVKYDAASYFSPLAGNEDTVSQTVTDTTEILVIDWDNEATPCNGGTQGVGEWWYTMLRGLTLDIGMSVAVTDDEVTDPLAGYNLDDYDVVVLALGINDADNTTLPASALAKLEGYRATGGKKIIVEGPDFGADYDGEDFFDNMNLNLVNDGSPDFNVAWFWGAPILWGNPARPYIAAEYDSAGDADHLVDVLATTSGITSPVGFDQDSIPRVFFYNGPSQAMIGSIYLGGMVDTATPQTRAVSAYLWKLGIPNDYIKQVDNNRPTEMAIVGAYPNPFNPVTTVKFEVPNAERVSVTVYDISGKVVETLIDLDLKPGTYSTIWDASGMPSGVYFVRMVSGSKESTGKLILMK